MFTNRTYKKGPSEKRALTGNSLNFSNQKTKKFSHRMENKTKEPQDPEGKNWIWKHVARKKLAEAKLKKAFRIKLFELCKSRSEKSSPDLFNFCKLGWSCHGQWRWQGYHVQAQFQSPVITNRTYKEWKAFWKKRALTGNSWKVSNQKTKNTITYGEQNKNHKTLKAKTEHESM